MDKKQAQFILHSFRPDGADAADADFTEALQLAVEDRDLGEWLADERATDAAFASALCEAEIPDELRVHILAVMRGEKPTDPAQEAEMDAIVSDALAHVDPPEGLRDQILAAMHVQQSQAAQASSTLPDEPANVTDIESQRENVQRKSTPSWFRLASVAAAVVLGVFLALQLDLGPKDNRDASVKIASMDIQRKTAFMLNTKFALDVMNPPKTEVNTWLVNHELPAPARLPAGLDGMKIMGCKRIQLAGDISASLLCFTKDSGGMVHLVVINNDYIKDAHLPGMDEIQKEDCYNCPKTGWDIAKWRDRENTFLLFAKKEDPSQHGVIQYF